MTALPHYTTSARNNKVNSTLIVSSYRLTMPVASGSRPQKIEPGIRIGIMAKTREKYIEEGEESNGNMLPGNAHK